MTTTHAMLPLAAAIGIARGPIPWRLVIAAAAAAALPDVDAVFNHLHHVPLGSVYSHRGLTHSLFMALVAGVVASLFAKRLRVRPITAGVVVAAAMASHGIMDMMTDSGRPVAYLWPLSSVRYFADWRPIHSNPVHIYHLFRDVLVRFRSELVQLIIPMFAIAFMVRAARILFGRFQLKHERILVSHSSSDELDRGA